MLSTYSRLDVNIGGEGVARIIATTQVTYPFNSYFRFDGKVLATGADGLALMESAADFDGDPINAFLETFATEMGYAGNKRLRFLYLLVETTGDIKIIFTVDKVVTRTITVTPDADGVQFIKVPVGRSAAGASWSFRVENVDGCWFALKELSALPIYLHKGRKVQRV